MWNSVEVHAIYDLVYTMCMSEEGVFIFGKFCGAQHTDVQEPLFIAQYMLTPVNTIVKNSLLKWMMKQEGPKTTNPNMVFKINNKCRGKSLKAEIFLKYNLLAEVMEVAKKYGQYYDYNFNSDETLTAIKSGFFNDQTKFNKYQAMLSFDSFMTIWLLTLPEKFEE